MGTTVFTPDVFGAKQSMRERARDNSKEHLDKCFAATPCWGFHLTFYLHKEGVNLKMRTLL